MQRLLTVHHGWTDTTPEESGYDPRTLKGLEDHYAELIGKKTIQAAGFLLARDGRVFAHRTIGPRTPKADSPDFMPDSIRKTYSITKVFVAAAIHQLIDRGKLFAKQKMSTIIPEFDTETHRNISLYHLLTHTSGLRGDPGFHFEPYGLPWYEWWYREARERYQDDSWIKLILSGPLLNEIGKEWYTAPPASFSWLKWCQECPGSLSSNM